MLLPILFIFLLVTSTIRTTEETKIVTSDGVELHVITRGNGIPVLYLHGGPGSGSYWMEAIGSYLATFRFD